MATPTQQQRLCNLTKNLSVSLNTQSILVDHLDMIDDSGSKREWSFTMGDNEVQPIGIDYDSTITHRLGGEYAADRYHVWHASGGTHWAGMGMERRYHGSRLMLVEVTREQTPNEHGRYREVARFNAGRDWRQVLSAAKEVCRELNAAHHHARLSNDE